MSSSTSTSTPSPTTTPENESKPRRGRHRVSAEHTLSRVRENQRRHRARRRDHVTELEEKLKETEKLLEEARREIEDLKKERDECLSSRYRQRAIIEGDMEVEVQDSRLSETNVRVGGEEILDLVPLDIPPPADTFDEEYPALPNAPESSTSTSFLFTFSPSSSLLPSPTPPSVGPPPCCNSSAELLFPADPSLAFSPPILLDPTDPECMTCATRPAPAPTESTTLCTQAYILIEQQNFRGIDATTIRVWLDKGFRRARERGEGCSVENGALLRVLDFISGV